MKPRICVLLLLVVASLTQSGCGKKAPPLAAAPDAGGVKVDMPKLYAAFATSDPGARAQAADAERDFRYGLYEKSLSELEALTKNPSLDEKQKALVNQVIEQLKQVIN